MLTRRSREGTCWHAGMLRSRGGVVVGARRRRDRVEGRARRRRIPTLSSVNAELGEVLADVVDDLLELAVEFEGLGLEAVVSVR